MKSKIKKRIPFYFGFVFCICITNIYAQTYQDILRFSQSNYSLTARSIGMGSAVGAVGSDFSSVTINPAGIGMYRNSEFMGSLQIARPTSTSDYRGQQINDDKYNINMPNIGLVIAGLGYDKGKVKREGWVAFNFGLGFSRTNSFHSNYTLESINKGTSIVESWRQEANGQDRDALYANQFSLAGLALQSGIIDTVPNTNNQYRSFPQFEYANFRKYQLDETTISGANNTINIAFGANHSNKLFLGAGIEIPIIGYDMTRTFTEKNLLGADSMKRYQGVKLTQNVTTSGAGFGLSFGGIYKPSDKFRFGLSIKIPTFLFLSDGYKTSIEASADKQSPYVASSPDGLFSYTMTLPFKTTLSAAYIFDKIGLISFDYEYVDYTMGRLSSSDYNFRTENKNAGYYLNAGNNFRVGGEIRQDLVTFRAGFQYLMSPYKSQFVSSGADGSGMVFSLGIGYRDQNFFMDLGWQKQTYSNTYNPFQLKEGVIDQTAKLVQRNSNFTLSIGTRF